MLLLKTTYRDAHVFADHLLPGEETPRYALPRRKERRMFSLNRPDYFGLHYQTKDGKIGRVTSDYGGTHVGFQWEGDWHQLRLRVEELETFTLVQEEAQP